MASEVKEVSHETHTGRETGQTHMIQFQTKPSKEK